MHIGTSSPVACLFISLSGIVTPKIHPLFRRLDDLTSYHDLRFPTEPDFFPSKLRVDTFNGWLRIRPNGSPPEAWRRTQRLSASRIQACPPPSVNLTLTPRSSLYARGYHPSMIHRRNPILSFLNLNGLSNS